MGNCNCNETRSHNNFCGLSGYSGYSGTVTPVSFGELYIQANSTVTTLPTAGSYVQITAGWSVGDSNSTTPNAGAGNITLNGSNSEFIVDITGNMTNATGSNSGTIAIFKNGTIIPSTVTPLNLQFATLLQLQFAMVNIIGLTTGDILDVRVSSSTNSTSIIFGNINFRIAAVAGTQGLSGTSGYSGANPGASGYSGYSGANPGASGYSGISGFSGDSGVSGFSGYSGSGSSPYIFAGGGTSIIIDLPGQGNSINSEQQESNLLNGDSNTINGSYSTIVTGSGNSISNNKATILNGFFNVINSGGNNCIVGGDNHTITGEDSNILGGVHCNISGTDSSIVTGADHIIIGSNSAILAGNTNTLSGTNSAILAGLNINSALGESAIAENFAVAQANAGSFSAGLATLASGTVTITTTQVTPNCMIFVTAQDSNTTGYLGVINQSVATGFTITSSNNTDSGVVAWMIIQLT